MKEIRVQAHGKINLVLNVGPVRDDGFHEVSMVMQEVEVCDELRLVKKQAPDRTIDLVCENFDLAEADNIAYRCARLMQEKYSLPGFQIFLRKTLPVAAGMAGGAIKSHYLDTAGRAGILRELYPELTIVGGIVLNRSVGGINSAAAERSAQAGGRMLWFPTMDALSYQRYHHRNDPGADLSSYLTVLDENDRLLPEVLDVLDVAAAYHLATGTGHLGAHEGMILVQEGLRRGCRMVLTHCDNPANFYTVEQQVEAVRWGAMIEHSYLTTLWGRTPIEEIARMIRATGCENVFLTTDYGQPKSPYTDEGMLQYAQDLLGQGFTEEDLDRMMRRNPARLIAPEA